MAALYHSPESAKKALNDGLFDVMTCGMMLDIILDHYFLTLIQYGFDNVYLGEYRRIIYRLRRLKEPKTHRSNRIRGMVI
jgi:hypothetical protein